jgi:hypothetical protein
MNNILKIIIFILIFLIIVFLGWLIYLVVKKDYDSKKHNHHPNHPTPPHHNHHHHNHHHHHHHPTPTPTHHHHHHPTPQPHDPTHPPHHTSPPGPSPGPSEYVNCLNQHGVKNPKDMCYCNKNERACTSPKGQKHCKWYTDKKNNFANPRCVPKNAHPTPEPTRTPMPKSKLHKECLKCVKQNKNCFTQWDDSTLNKTPTYPWVCGTPIRNKKTNKVEISQCNPFDYNDELANCKNNFN